MFYLNTTVELRIVEFALVACLVAVGMGMAHAGLRPGSDWLPRWAAYVIGVGIIFVGWMVWRGLICGDWRAVAELAGLIVAGAVAPTAGRAMRNYRHVQQWQAERRAAAEVRQARSEAMDE